AEPENLAVDVAGEDAVRALGFERHDGDVPRTGTIGGSDAAARQPLERFELEDRACRPDRTDGCRWDCHNPPSLPSPAAVAADSQTLTAIRGPAIWLRQTIGRFGSPLQGSR